jgi:hypothetical protein
MDNLEKFIRNNRNDLDRYDPSPEIWSEIKEKISHRKKIMRAWLSAAATITLIFGLSLFAYSIFIKNRQQREAGNIYQQEFRETEFFYNTMVNSLYQEAKPLLTSHPEIERELKTDLEHIDKICSEIKRDLNDNIDNQDVIEALIQNYKIKIQLLEDMLVTLKENENNTEKRNSNEL